MSKINWIDQSYTILEQKPGIEGMYQQIEDAGRTCYKSTGTRYFKVPYTCNEVLYPVCPGIDNIISYQSEGLNIERATNIYDDIFDKFYISISQNNVKKCPGIEKYEVTPSRLNDPFHLFKNVTAYNFVESVLKKNGHGAMLEHGSVYLDAPLWRPDILFRYTFNKYSRLKFAKGKFLITTNYRVVSEKHAEKDLQYFSEDISRHYKRPCVRFIMDRVGSQSVERHRGMYGISFAQESTRFCNYSNENKFDGLTFIIPRWMYDLRDRLSQYINSSDKSSNEWMLNYYGAQMVNMLIYEDRSASTYVEACRNAADDYIFLTTTEESQKLKPQDARGILPLQVKTEFVMTAFDIDWKHFFELRDEPHAHPDIQWIAHRLHEEEIFKNV